MGKWDWQVFLQDTGGGRTYLEWLMSAWGWTLSVAILSLLVALVVGSLMGILRTTPSKGLVLPAAIFYIFTRTRVVNAFKGIFEPSPNDLPVEFPRNPPAA